MKNQTLKSAFFNSARPLVFGHKGSASDRPENTLSSFDKALKDDADVLETDLRLTKDGEIVLMHDAFLERVTNGTGNVRDYTLAQLKELDAAYQFSQDDGKTFPLRGQGHTIPTLEEAFQRYPGIKMNIDMKSRNPALAQKVADLLVKYDRADITIAGSFHHKNVRRLRRHMKGHGVNVQTCASDFETKAAVVAAKLHIPGHTSPLLALEVPVSHGSIQVITKEFIKHAHANGRYVVPWTINDPKEMESLLKMGVDGIITDNPKLAAKVIDKFMSAKP